MSEAREKKKRISPSGRMTSITRKLHFQIFRKKLFFYLGMDLLLSILLPFAWVIEQELRELGSLQADRGRRLDSITGVNRFDYVVTEDGVEVLRLNATYAAIFFAIIIGSLMVIQLVTILVSWYGESKKIRDILQPINDIALRADAMSKLSFSDAIYNSEGSPEESFQRLEQAISELNPEQETMPSLGNQELLGIEAAMNNLLRRMHESYQQQARFVNDASHELRTPIAVIQGYAGMLERWGREDEDVLNESITAISHEANHMNQLVEQLLFLARGDSGRTKLKNEKIEISSMMEEIYEESLMIDEAHPYRYRAPGEEVSITGDPTLLKQAVRILIDNAAKYTHPGDEITLSTGLNQEGCPYLQVQDSGIGMAQSDVEHMFERFYRSDEAREIKGTGLGLAIAKWIVDRHKGHFEILSRTELGTRIRMVLPKECIVKEAPIRWDDAPEVIVDTAEAHPGDHCETPDTAEEHPSDHKETSESRNQAEG